MIDYHLLINESHLIAYYTCLWVLLIIMKRFKPCMFNAAYSKNDYLKFYSQNKTLSVQYKKQSWHIKLFDIVSAVCCRNILYCRWPQPGPALASARPDWKHFCGSPLSGVCIGHQVIMIEIVDVKERGLGYEPQFQLSSRDFNGQRRKCQFTLSSCQ